MVMGKIFVVLIMFLILGCSSTKQLKQVPDDNFSLKDEMNKSVIEGFYDGDTIGKSNSIYLLK